MTKSKSSKTLIIKTSENKEVVDITDNIERILNDLGVENGLVNIFALHTTCALTVADLDPGTDRDYLDAFTNIIPSLDYRHPHDPGHVGDHILSALIGITLVLPVEDKKLVLGTWQRIVLVEFSGPRERSIKITKV